MTDFVALRSLVFAAECFFGASLILVLAWMLARDGSAARRHLVWLCAFCAMLVLPVAAFLVPPQVILHMPAEPTVILTQADMAIIASLHAAPAPQPIFTLPHAVMALLAVWLIGVAVIAAQTLTGLIGLFFLHQRSVPHIPNGIDGAMFRGARWQLRLRTMPGNEGPVTYGILKPTVLLPKVSVRWSRARLEAVLLHEFAHVRRHDALARLIALMACAFYWPNPFVWSAAARLRRDAEIAADDAVLCAGVRASSYAEALVGLARECERTALAGVTLSMAERSTLKDRIQSVLSPARSRMGVTRMDMLKIGVSCLAITAGLVLARPCLAESKPADVMMAPEAAADAPDAVSAPSPVPDVAPLADATPHAVSAVAPLPPVAPEAPPAPPAPAAVATPPAPPAPPAHARHVVHVMRFETPDGVKEMKWENDGEADDAMASVAPEFQKAIADAHKNMANLKKRVIVIDRRKMDKAMAEAMKVQVTMNKAQMRQMMAQAQAERVKALEESRAEIDRELAEARQAVAEARREAETDK